MKILFNMDNQISLKITKLVYIESMKRKPSANKSKSIVKIKVIKAIPVQNIQKLRK